MSEISRLRHATWNPITGLTIDTKAGGEVRFNEQWLDQPLRWSRPRTVFVCAHGDLFHESVPDEWIDRVFAVMALAPQHTFQILTKRAARMRAYLTERDSRQRWRKDAVEVAGMNMVMEGIVPQARATVWPLPNVWLGISAEDQTLAEDRAGRLLNASGRPAMADRPILFSGSMVRAILREIEQPGTGKTMTRRVLNPQPPADAELVAPPFLGDGQDLHVQFRGSDGLPGKSQPLRYSRGDRLWVREALQCDRMENFLTGERDLNAAVAYYASDDTEVVEQRGFNVELAWKRGTLPARFMPRWASRITLIVTDVRVRRLQDISEEDAIAEGISMVVEYTPPSVWFSGQHEFINDDAPNGWHHNDAQAAFRDLWNTINAKREGGKYAWAANPWVAAYTFRPILGNVDQIVGAA